MKQLRVKDAATTRVLGRMSRTIIATVAIVIGLAVIGFVIVDRFNDGKSAAQQSAWNERYDQMARVLAQEVEQTLAPYVEALDTIAADTRVRAALRSGDPTQLTAVAAEMVPVLPHILALRVLPAAARDPDMDAQPPLTFASMSMIRRAREEGRAPPAEVHLAGTAGEHIALLARVTAPHGGESAATLLGFVHLSVDPDVVRTLLSAKPPADVYAEIRQGTNVRLVASGRAPAGDAPASVVPVKGTTLAVSFKGEGALVGGAKPGLSLTTVAFAGVVVVALVAVFVWNGRRQAVRVGPLAAGDAIIYQGAIKAILDGSLPGLEQLLPRARAAGGAPDAVSIAELERAEGEDVTTFRGTSDGADEDPTEPRLDDADADDFFAVEGPLTAAAVPASIFRGYDIRGIVGETLTEDGVYQIGRALGAEAEARNQKTVVVARDGRHSSEALSQALVTGLLESGRDVLDIGLAPTPVLYFATHYLDAQSGVMVTGSHNAAEYNGLKIVLDGEALSGSAIEAIQRRIGEQDFIDGTGSLQSTDIVAEYIRRISEEIPVTLGHALKIVVDCANSVPGVVAPDILRAIGHDVIELYCDVDGDFPNHHPDPSQPENLTALVAAVLEEGADLGLAFDGDGDRLGVVDGAGNVIWPDRQMILFARDILAHHPGAKIIFDVKCSSLLGVDIAAHGGEPIMARSGHALIKGLMQETGALLAGEMSGHIFFKDRWYGFDDAIYSAARLLEIIVNSGQAPTALFAGLPGGVATPELRLDMAEDRHAGFMQQVLAAADFPGAAISTIDGLRVDFTDGWGLVRPSNTAPCLVLRFEGDDAAALAGVQQKFRALLTGIDATLDLPF